MRTRNSIGCFICICPLVCQSVRRSVRVHRVEKWKNERFRYFMCMSMIVWKIFKSSSNLDQAESWSSIRLEWWQFEMSISIWQHASEGNICVSTGQNRKLKKNKTEWLYKNNQFCLWWWCPKWSTKIRDFFWSLTKGPLELWIWKWKTQFLVVCYALLSDSRSRIRTTLLWVFFCGFANFIYVQYKNNREGNLSCGTFWVILKIRKN